MYLWKNDEDVEVEINLWDFAHVFYFMLFRPILMSIKYGFYSPELFKIIRTIRLDDNYLDKQ